MIGKKNIYTCPFCKTQTVTIDKDEGTTPFMIFCPKCKEKHFTHMAQSSFYRVDQTLKPTHEWYKPDTEEMKELEKKRDLATIDHVIRGGLLLREIK